MKLKQTQQGSSAPEIIIVILLLSVIGLISFFVFNQQTNKSRPSASSAKTQMQRYSYENKGMSATVLYPKGSSVVTGSQLEVHKEQPDLANRKFLLARSDGEIGLTLSISKATNVPTAKIEDAESCKDNRLTIEPQPEKQSGVACPIMSNQKDKVVGYIFAAKKEGVSEPYYALIGYEAPIYTKDKAQAQRILDQVDLSKYADDIKVILQSIEIQ